MELKEIEVQFIKIVINIEIEGEIEFSIFLANLEIMVQMSILKTEFHLELEVDLKGLKSY